MINENKIFDVVIYGNGLSAKSALVALIKQEYKILWINNINKEENDDRTTMLSPVSVDFYQKLNLNNLRSIVFPTKKILIKTKNQKNFTTFEDKKFQKTLCFLAENKFLHKELNIIISNQKKKKNFLELNEDIDKLNSNKNYNEIILKSGKRIHTSLIIGVDGANSLIRDLSNIKSKDKGIKKYGLVGLIEHDQTHPFTSWQVFSENGILALLAKENITKTRSVSSMIWSLDKNQMECLFNLDKDDFEKKIKNEIGLNLGKLSLISKISKWPIKRIDVSNPIGLRSVVLGDAAHAIYPLAGQGFNLAIGDVSELVKTLNWARNHGLDLGSSVVLNKYENKRKVWVNSITKLTDGLDWFFTNTSVQTQNILGTTLNFVDNFDSIKRKLLETMVNN